MKKLMSIAVVLCAELLFAEGNVVSTNAVNGATPKRSTEEMREAIRMKTGGFVYDKRGAEGVFVFVNAQKRVHAEVIELQGERLERDIWLEVETRNGEPVNLTTADAAFKALKANLAVFVIDDNSLPSLVIVPEKRWALVNVAALADGVDEKTLAQRTAKEMLRAMAFVYGAGYSITNTGAHVPIKSISDLDYILLQTMPIEVSSVIQRLATERYGFKCFRRCFYSTACEEGWAPAPKNKYQEHAAMRVKYMKEYEAGKAAAPTEEWQRQVIKFVNEQRKAPANPIKIEYDPAKGE